jgi:hypothetical protein
LGKFRDGGSYLVPALKSVLDKLGIATLALNDRFAQLAMTSSSCSAGSQLTDSDCILRHCHRLPRTVRLAGINFPAAHCAHHAVTER